MTFWTGVTGSGGTAAAVGVVAALGADAALVTPPDVAVTVTVTGTPFGIDRIVHVVPDVVHVWPLLAVATYDTA
jgi:hypothetical protein